MATETLQAASKLVLGTEGGWSDHKLDPGGPTNKGVTLETLTGWWLKENPAGPKPTVDDLRKLSDDEAIAIFDAQYATPIQYNDLPAGLDYCTLDTSVNSGPSRATKILQQALGFAPGDIDGALGSKTLGAAKSATDIAALIARYSELRLDFMKTLKVWGTFGKGWTNRVNAVGDQALAFARGQQPTPTFSPVPIQAKATGPTRLLSGAHGKAAAGAVAGVAITAGGVATQIATALTPYSNVKAVGYLLLGCSVLASTVPLWVTLRKASTGENAA